MMKEKKKISLWERYLTKEISIEFKACLYFFAILFFYCVYRLCIHVTVAEILHMTEMILLTYAIGYLQVYVFWNFDEAERFGAKEFFGAFCCVIIYSAASYVFNWFNKSIPLTIGFAVYVVVVYVSVWLIYKVRRTIDDKLLNDNLALFQTRHNK